MFIKIKLDYEWICQLYNTKVYKKLMTFIKKILKILLNLL